MTPEEINRMNEQLTKFTELKASIDGFGEVVETLTPFIDAFSETVKRFYGGMWKMYRDAGMPNGESENGMIEWFKELWKNDN